MKKSIDVHGAKKPAIHLGFPIWWHHHGSKMKLESLIKSDSLLLISGSAAHIGIVRKADLNSNWWVEWEVVQSPGAKVNGSIVLSPDELRAAFGLSEESGDFGDWLLAEYGGDSAEQGKFIRWKNFLNIPCPGTGHDGDPNVSVELDEDIQNAVRQLLKS